MDRKTYPLSPETFAWAIQHAVIRDGEPRDVFADNDNASFEGVEVRPSDGRRSDRLILHYTTPSGKKGETVLDPPVVSPDEFDKLVARATPESVEDYMYYIKDIREHFVGHNLIQSYDGYRGEHYAIEERSCESYELIDRIEKAFAGQAEKLGDDFSVNAAARAIATEFMNEAREADDPELYASQFAKNWLAMKFDREIAYRTATDSYSDRNNYEKGSRA